MRISKNGKIKGFHKGNTYYKNNIGKKLSNETKKKKSIAMQAFYEDNPITRCGFQKNHQIFEGCKKSWFTTEKMKGNTNGFKKEQIPWNKNKTKEELLTHYKNGWKIKHYSGEEHWNWQNGKSFEIYPKEFKLIKIQIISTQQICQLCNSDRHLVVHHIDKDKKNNNINNLIVLCRRCHGKVHQGGLKCK